MADSKRKEMKSVGILMGLFILIALLCFGSDAEAQNRKVRICVPGARSAVISGKKAWTSTYSLRAARFAPWR
jgi:hypothetical protein